MPDPIHALQRLIRVFNPGLVRFTPENWTPRGIAPDPVRAAQARWGNVFGHRLFSRQYPGVPGRVHLHDNMLMDDSPASLAQYVKVGESALANIEASLALAGMSFADLRAVLDFPSGYGRVLRHLVRRVPPARVTACELEPEGLAFCAQEFGVKAVPSSKDVAALRFPESYDLIWVGSLFTHLPPPAGLALIARLADQLYPGGLLIFSTQGESCLEHVPMYGFMFRDCEAEYRDQVARQGFGYLPYYAHDPGYGIAFYARDYLAGLIAERLPRVRLLRHAERGLDHHQDVWTVQKLEGSRPAAA